MNELNKSSLYGTLIEPNRASGGRTADVLAAVPWSLVAIACAVVVALVF